MPPRPIAFDLTRLIGRLRHASPTGIDRVDLAYARHVMAGDGPRFGILSTPFGPRVLDHARSRAIVDAVVAGWVEDARAEDDAVFRALADRLGAPLPEARLGQRTARGAAHRRAFQALTALRALRARGTDALPRGTVYLNTSHMGLDRPRRFDWLHDRRDLRAVFFVHDLIPISHPEYGRAGEAARHAQRMETIARHAAHVVVNSADVGARFSAHLAERGLAARSVTVAPLGIEPVFLEKIDGTPAFARPTFLVCGTIEARKNHLLLLQIWRGLAERHGAEAPRLVVVGRRGWEAENVVDMLERGPASAAHVVEVAGLSTPGLARLMRAATALLMPSFIEGYGLPIVEAAASGLPVVASDIPVHREVASRFAHLIDPLDGPGWAEAVEALSLPGSGLRETLAVRLDGYEPPSWAAHFARVDAALADLDAPDLDAS